MLLFYSSLVILLMACIFVDHQTGHQLHQEVFISEGRKVYPWRVNLEIVLIMFHSDFFGVNLFLNYHRHNVNIQAVRKVFSCFITYFDNAKFPVVFIWCDDGSRLNLQKIYIGPITSWLRVGVTLLLGEVITNFATIK